MLTFYYHPLSPIARRVWIALLEKEIPFEPVVVNLNGEQLKPNYLALNPFHHVPVVVDDDIRILESLAILDFLEAKYTSISLMPQNPTAIAKMRMVQMVTTNELTPKLPSLATTETGSSPDETTLKQIYTVFDFFTEQIGEADYMGGDRLSLADITAGATLPLLIRLGVDLDGYEAIANWYHRLASRPAWQQTELDDESFNTWKRWIALMIKRRQRQMAKA